MYDVQHKAQLDAAGVLFMRNPPWALPLAYPLGFIPLRIAAFLWNLLLLACLLTSVQMVRVMHGSPKNYVHWLGLAFTPAIICLDMGQTGLLTLLGMVLFLRLHKTHEFAAGLALWLCALKPHLLLPFCAVLLIWIIVSRRYKILAGWLLTMATSTALAWWIDPSAWNRYLALMRSNPVQYEFVPTLSDAMRFWIHGQWIWLQYVPAACACVWALFYFWPRRSNWDWLDNGSLLLLVSVLVAPYCFPADQCIVIPAVLHGMYKTRSRAVLALVAAILLAIQFEAWNVRIISGYYMWMTPTWLACYLLAMRWSEAVDVAPVPAVAET
ncbi:MAG TPA: glycosyltransferase family 87 protein [Terracidiphilus sp.]|nr:glycosyltransferase family 87 protein [Terracidiphilus sp.]